MTSLCVVDPTRASTDSALGDGLGRASPNAEYRDRNLRSADSSGRVDYGLKEEPDRPDESYDRRPDLIAARRTTRWPVDGSCNRELGRGSEQLPAPLRRRRSLTTVVSRRRCESFAAIAITPVMAEPATAFVQQPIAPQAMPKRSSRRPARVPASGALSAGVKGRQRCRRREAPAAPGRLPRTGQTDQSGSRASLIGCSTGSSSRAG